MSYESIVINGRRYRGVDYPPEEGYTVKYYNGNLKKLRCARLMVDGIRLNIID